MNQAFSRMKQIFKQFGKRQYTYEDFLRIARRYRINIVTRKLPDKIRAYYQCEIRKVYRKKWIVFNENLSVEEKLHVAFHELAHHFLHSSYTNKTIFFSRAKRAQDSAQDCEAEAVALVMRLPAQKFLELIDTPFEEIRDFTIDQLIRRQRIFEKDDYGIFDKSFLPFTCENRSF